MHSLFPWSHSGIALVARLLGRATLGDASRWQECRVLLGVYIVLRFYLAFVYTG